ncbi:MAG: hypothetical protein ACLFWD_01740 [Anaerolineales bacterium]
MAERNVKQLHSILCHCFPTIRSTDSNLRWDRCASDLIQPEHAAAKVPTTLEGYQAPGLEPRLHAELTRFIEAHKGNLLSG